MASESLDQCLELWHGGGSLAHCHALVSGSISHPWASVFSSSLREGVMVVCSRTGVWVLECFCALVLQGEFRVAERKVTMKELKRALEEGRVREVFGSGTACQVCPVHQILYEGKVRQSCRGGWERKKGSAPSSWLPFPSNSTFLPWKMGRNSSCASRRS